VTKIDHELQFHLALMVLLKLLDTYILHILGMIKVKDR